MRRRGSPPAIGTTSVRSPTTNASRSPSGEMRGAAPPVVPGIARADASTRLRYHSIVESPCVAVYTTNVPFGATDSPPLIVPNPVAPNDVADDTGAASGSAASKIAAAVGAGRRASAHAATASEAVVTHASATVGRDVRARAACVAARA